MTKPSLSFSRPVHVSDIPARGKKFSITANETECRAVAQRLGLPEINKLQAELKVSPFGVDGLEVAGTVRAVVTMTCVLSSETFENEVEAPVRLCFSPDGVDPNAEFDLAELTKPDADDPPDLLVDNRIDLGDIIGEFLALSLDPYPRKPGVQFSNVEQDASFSPFAVLKKNR